MGEHMSKLRVLIRPVKNYNVESRAMKEISKDKPKAAPYHPTFQKQQIDSMPIENEGNPELLKNLTNVYIKSEGDNAVITAKKLPHERKTPTDMMWGFEEPEVVPRGKMSLRQAYTLLSEHNANPEEVTALKASEKEGISHEDAQHIFKYYYTYTAAYPIKDKATSSTLVAVNAVNAYLEKIIPNKIDFKKLNDGSHFMEANPKNKKKDD